MADLDLAGAHSPIAGIPARAMSSRAPVIDPIFIFRAAPPDAPMMSPAAAAPSPAPPPSSPSTGCSSSSSAAPPRKPWAVSSAHVKPLLAVLSSDEVRDLGETAKVALGTLCRENVDGPAYFAHLILAVGFRDWLLFVGENDQSRLRKLAAASGVTYGQAPPLHGMACDIVRVFDLDESFLLERLSPTTLEGLARDLKLPLTVAPDRVSFCAHAANMIAGEWLEWGVRALLDRFETRELIAMCRAATNRPEDHRLYDHLARNPTVDYSWSGELFYLWLEKRLDQTKKCK